LTSIGQAMHSRIQSGNGTNASVKGYYTTFPCLLSTPPIALFKICILTSFHYRLYFYDSSRFYPPPCETWNTNYLGHNQHKEEEL